MTRFEQAEDMLNEVELAISQGSNLRKDDYPKELLLGIATENGREWHIRISKLRNEFGWKLINIHWSLPDSFDGDTIQLGEDGNYYIKED